MARRNYGSGGPTGPCSFCKLRKLLFITSEDGKLFSHLANMPDAQTSLFMASSSISFSGRPVA